MVVGGDKSRASPRHEHAGVHSGNSSLSMQFACDASCNALLHLAWGGLESNGGISSMLTGLTNILSQSSVVNEAFVRGGVFDRFRRSAASCSFPFMGVSIVPFAGCPLLLDISRSLLDCLG